MNSSAGQWLQVQISGFRALKGRVVTGWRACEMALGGDEEGPPEALIWYHPSVAMLQLYKLDIALADGLIAVRIAQADDIWGLYLPTQASDLGPDLLGSIFRARPLSELPTGLIDGVEVAVEDDMVASVDLIVAGRRVTLMTGEVYEEAEGLRVERCDESILVQVDGEFPATP